MFEVLLEFRGSRIPLLVTTETVHSVIKAAANVEVLQPGAPPGDQPQSVEERLGDVYILQRFSTKWSNFVDVQRVEDVTEGDRLTLTVQVFSGSGRYNSLVNYHALYEIRLVQETITDQLECTDPARNDFLD